MNGIASRLGCSEGQVWTLLLSFALVGVLIAYGIVPASRGLDISDLGLAPPPGAAPLTPSETQTPASSVEPPVVVVPPATTALPLPLPVPGFGSVVTPPVTAEGPFPSTTPMADSTPTATASGIPSSPYLIVGTAWFTAYSDSATVPPGSLPVGAALGTADKITLLRVTGNSGTLTLAETADPQLGADAAQILLCPLKSGATFRNGPGQPFADLPAYDCESAVTGARAADGTWAFALRGAATTGGYALVPAGSDTSAFRVQFTDPTASAGTTSRVGEQSSRPDIRKVMLP